MEGPDAGVSACGVQDWMVSWVTCNMHPGAVECLKLVLDGQLARRRFGMQIQRSRMASRAWQIRSSPVAGASARWPRLAGRR
jgi:hypothetical protein